MITASQEKILNDLYVASYFGRDKLFSILPPNSGISRTNVADYLAQLEIHSTHRQQPRLSTVKPILSKTALGRIQIDETHFLGKILLTAIDVFSKHAWIKVLPNESAKASTQGLEKILNEIKLPIKIIQTDNGSHFKDEFHSFLLKNNIKHIYSTAHTPTAQGVIERFHRTLKNALQKHVDNGGGSWEIIFLPKWLENYNKASHESIENHTPTTMLTTQDKDLQHKVQTAQQERAKKVIAERQKALSNFGDLKVGDTVRVKLARDHTSLQKSAQQSYENQTKKITGYVQQKNGFTNYKVSNDTHVFARHKLLKVPSTVVHAVPLMPTPRVTRTTTTNVILPATTQAQDRTGLVKRTAKYQ